LLTINAGEGGTDAADWAGMLERMYLRWAERHHFSAEILDQTEGEEAGIKSVSNCHKLVFMLMAISG